MPRRKIDPSKFRREPPPGDDDNPQGGYWRDGIWHSIDVEARGMPPFVPTEDQINLTRELAGLGVPYNHVARLIGCSLPTLHKYLQDVLDEGKAMAVATGAAMAWKAIFNGDTQVLMKWMAMHGGWVMPKEPPPGGLNAEHKEVADLTDDELDAELNWIKEAQGARSASRAVASRLP